MRIAMLAPITRRIPPRPYGPEEQLISDLCEGLLERGHQVMLFATGDSLTRAELVAVCPRPLSEWDQEPWPDPRWWEELHIGECMLQARRGCFDLVHNHMHVKALPYAAMLPAPVLTSLHGAARDEQIHHLLQRYGEYPFVAMDHAEKRLFPDINYVGAIPLPDPEEKGSIQRMVESHLEIYEHLVSGGLASPVSELRRITPWGSWEVLRDEPGFKVKRIKLEPGHRLSYQRHKNRREHWTVVAGKALVVLDGEEIELLPGQSVDIPEESAHRIGNPGHEPMVFIEVQTGTYFGEDDIERLEDDYGR